MASPLSLDVEYHFGVFQCLPVDDCSAVSCDSGVLARGSESTSFYSAILNQSPKKTFCSDGYAYFLDCSHGFTGV